MLTFCIKLFTLTLSYFRDLCVGHFQTIAEEKVRIINGYILV